MNEFDDLFKKYGPAKQDDVVTLSKPSQFDDLVKKFVGDKIEIPSAASQEIGPPRPEEAANYKPTEYEGRSIMRGIKNLPGNILKSVVEDAKSGAATVAQGINDLASNRPASGLGNVGMGVLGAVFSPATGTIKEVVEKPVTELTGSPEIGSKAGFVAGLGLPLARIGKSVSASIPSNAAFDKLVNSIGIDNIPDVLKRLKGNERLTFADVAPGTRQDAQALVVQQGDHQASLVEKINKRQAGARGQVEKLYDESMGAPIDVVQKIEQLKKRAQDTGKTYINPIVENSKPVDVTATIKAIDNAIAEGGPVERATLKALKAGKEPSLPLSDAQNLLFNARERIRGDWKDNPQMFMDVKGKQGLHEVQMNLRREAQSLLDSQNPLDHKLGRELMNVRNNLVEAGGKEYKEALGKYADDMSVSEAFTNGQNVLRNRPTHIEDRPEYLAKYLKTAKPDEIEALREGARVAIDNQIRSAKNAALKGEVIPEMEFNRKKLEMLFGKKEVDQLATKLKDERDIAKTTVDLLHGSQTASRQASNARVDLPVKKESSIGAVTAPLAEIAMLTATGGAVPGLGIASVLAQKAAGVGIHKGKTALARKTNSEYADLLFSEGEQRAALIKALEQKANNSNQLSISQKLNLSLPNALKNVVARP